MLKRCMMVLALALLQGEAAATVNITDPYPAWRATAANVLATHSDANSLASAAALTFLGSPSRSKAETGKASSAALALGRKAGELAPDNSAISWLYLQLCTNTPGCDIRDAATTMRWVAADNSVAWLPTLASAQKDKDSTEADRVLESMAQTEHFDLYGNRATLLIFDALRRARHELPGHYLASDAARFSESIRDGCGS